MSFIIIQPILLGTWSTLAMVGAAAMLLQIPYAIDELLASLQFVRRRARAGQSWLRVFFVGDTDEGTAGDVPDEFDRSPIAVLKDMASGGVGLPWNLALSAAIGLWLLFTRETLGASGTMANADHLIGALILTVISIAAAEVTRAVRFLNIPLGLALIASPFLYHGATTSVVNGIVCGLVLMALSLRRGTIRQRYRGWEKLIV
jgi:hypothetical protein